MPAEKYATRVWLLTFYRFYLWS